MLGHAVEVQAAARCRQHFGYRLDLLGHPRGPRALRHGHLGGLRLCVVLGRFGLRFSLHGDLLALPALLELRPQPAHRASGFLRGALGVQLDQPHQQRVSVGGQGQVGPAVGQQHGGVQLVVQALEHAHQAVFVDDLFLGRQRLAAAQLLQHVVNRRERDVGMGGLLGLTVGVDLLRQRADAPGQRPGRVKVGEGEGFKASGLDVDRPVFESTSRSGCPNTMETAGQHAQVESVLQGNHHQLVVRHDVS